MSLSPSSVELELGHRTQSYHHISASQSVFSGIRANVLSVLLDCFFKSQSVFSGIRAMMNEKEKLAYVCLSPSSVELEQSVKITPQKALSCLSPSSVELKLSFTTSQANSYSCLSPSSVELKQFSTFLPSL